MFEKREWVLSCYRQAENVTEAERHWRYDDDDDDDDDDGHFEHLLL
jgi:hypothetical protein